MNQSISTEQSPLRPSAFDALCSEVARLSECLHELAMRIAAFENGVDACLTTRRVEVIDAAGVPRVVLSAGPHRASVEVRTTRASPHSTAVEIFAAEAALGDEAQAGLELVESGDVVVALTVFEQAQPSLWLATPDDHPSGPTTVSERTDPGTAT